jgi:hypothetical protein
MWFPAAAGRMEDNERERLGIRENTFCLSWGHWWVIYFKLDLTDILL